MPAKYSLVYIMHIRDSCRRIAEYTVTGGDSWTSKPLIMDAVCRKLELIREMAEKDVPELLAPLPSAFGQGVTLAVRSSA